MIFSAWTQFSLRILYEFWKEKETGLKMTVPDLKRRIGVSIGMREAGQAVRALKEASLIGYELNNGYPKFFYTENIGKATLYDLVMAMDGRVGFGAKYLNARFYHLPPEFTCAADTEAAVARQVGTMLKNIRLRDLLPANGLGDWGLEDGEYCNGSECPCPCRTFNTKAKPETCSPL